MKKSQLRYQSIENLEARCSILSPCLVVIKRSPKFSLHQHISSVPVTEQHTCEIYKRTNVNTALINMICTWNGALWKKIFN